MSPPPETKKVEGKELAPRMSIDHVTNSREHGWPRGLHADKRSCLGKIESSVGPRIQDYQFSGLPPPSSNRWIRAWNREQLQPLRREISRFPCIVPTSCLLSKQPRTFHRDFLLTSWYRKPSKNQWDRETLERLFSQLTLIICTWKQRRFLSCAMKQERERRDFGSCSSVCGFLQVVLAKGMGSQIEMILTTRHEQ